MSSGEEFEVGEILEQRKRKGFVEYLVRWKGFNELYDSWEPATGLADCTKVLKAFVSKKKRSRSKSRSRSGGRGSKSRSRSSSRGRATKSDTTPKRSRSRSGGRKTKSSSKISTESSVTKKEASSEEQQKPKSLRSRTQLAEEKASSKTETVLEKTSTTKQGELVEQKTEVVKTSVETVKSTSETKTESSGMTTRARLAVRQVENDQKPAAKAANSRTEENGTWLWWFADHAVLILFIIVSLIALSFTVESLSGVRDKLVPDLGVLRQRLGESYEHFVQALTTGYNNLAGAALQGFNNLKAAVFFTGNGASTEQSQATPPPKTPA